MTDGTYFYLLKNVYSMGIHIQFMNKWSSVKHETPCVCIDYIDYG